jgi:hypothetical protein
MKTETAKFTFVESLVIMGREDLQLLKRLIFKMQMQAKLKISTGNATF